MGKFQLDYKGQAQVQRFHEKHSKGTSDKQARLQELRAQFLKQKAKNQKPDN